ncbi:transcriptional regulator, HxlR family [Vibrio xiamenensis]|uniref:Transcriptional regulator, HxlR family n=1 Tax=Vibrio xiamenensis TaxID=861298 RepID=A0A1G8DQU4_9VIBR|nr:helix-turn-helix domain-containing protein [Vibrio xiamenensis]SDH60042.1 transcriptional regulator, HxlR family [Vibrio xiamenensis]
MLDTTPDLPCFDVDCPTRLLFDQISDKWSMMVLTLLNNQPLRFNAIKRALQGITQKSLTLCLRKLERNGLISRHVIPSSQVAVEYRITELGTTLYKPFRQVYEWLVIHQGEIEQAQREYDQKQLLTA